MGNEPWEGSRRTLISYNEIKSKGSLGKNTGAPTCNNTRFKDSACVYR